MIKEETKFIDSTVFEGMTSIRAILSAIDNKISDRKIIKVLFDKDKYNKNRKNISYLRAVSEQYNYEILESTAEEIEKFTLGNSHGGIIAFASERTIPSLTESSDISDNGFYCMIEGIEDPYNFGYSLRSLYATGCNGIILPERNWMSAAGVVSRSSAGASELFPIFKADAILAAEIFKKKGYTIVCADEDTQNILGKCELKLPILLIVGGEKRGISSALMKYADIKVKINYKREFKASLSAASATTMFAYEIMRQN